MIIDNHCQNQRVFSLIWTIYIPRYYTDFCDRAPIFDIVNLYTSKLPVGYAQRVWSDFVVDPVDPNTCVYTPEMATVAITLGNDGIPTSIYTTSTTPYFVPFTFNITVTNFNNLDTPFTTFICQKNVWRWGFLGLLVSVLA